MKENKIKPPVVAEKPEGSSVPVPVVSDENPKPEVQNDYWFYRERSDSNALFWIGVNGAVIGHEAGIGVGGQLNLRLKLGRCAILGSYQVQDITVWDPADVHNNVGGLGTMCTLKTFGQKHRGVRGAHLAASLQAQFGRTRYHNYDKSEREINNGTNTAFGGAVGVDFYFPLVFGFWVNAGVGYEKMGFKYEVPYVAGMHDHLPNEIGNFHLGV